MKHLATLTEPTSLPHASCHDVLDRGAEPAFDLTISIVSFQTPLLLRQCLDAIAPTRQELRLQVIVVDNASGDESAALVEQNYPWVQLVRNPRNLGFGAAHNQAIRQANARAILLLNSDAAPRPGALSTLVRYLDDHADVGVVGPLLRYPDGRIQPSRRRFPTNATFFFESTQLQRFFPRNGILRRYYFQDQSDAREQDVDWLVGACLCVRTEAIAAAGLFDEHFFMYSEEIDWCRRIRQHGWRIVFLPTVEVAHVEGGSSQRDLAARDRAFQTSKLRYAAKWHGAWVARALRLYLVLEYLVRALEESIKLAMGSRVHERRARLKVIRSGLGQALRG
jgi:GT2 family glycosyltransferase